MDINSIKTGDTVLFSNNTPTGFLLRTAISSEWNHSGIIVRFKTNPEGHKVISLTTEGEIYVLETNTGIRRDDIFSKDVIGAGFSRANWVFSKYNKISVRKINDIFRTPELATLTMKFAEITQGHQFPKGSLPFLGVWLGISLEEKNDTNTSKFCSELMCHYYKYCIGSQFSKIIGKDYDGKLSTLFGVGSPENENLFTPSHYTFEKSPNAPIFNGSEKTIQTSHADIIYVLLQPFLIIIVIMIIIYMTLP